MCASAATYKCWWADLPEATRDRLIVTGTAAVSAYLQGEVPERDQAVIAYVDGVSKPEEPLSEDEVREMLDNRSFEFPEVADAEEEPLRKVYALIDTVPESQTVAGMRVAEPEVAVEDCAMSNPRIFTQRLRHEPELREFTEEHHPALYRRHMSAIEGGLTYREEGEEEE